MGETSTCVQSSEADVHLADPAVTVGMYLIGAIDFLRAVLLFVTQIVAAIAAAAIVSGLFTGGLNVSTTLSTTTTVAQGVIIEMILTMALVFTIFMLAAEKHAGNFIAPVGIGLCLFVAELTGKLASFPTSSLMKQCIPS